LKADFIFANIQTTSGAKSAKSKEQVGVPFHSFLGQKLLDREHLVSWSIVMVENPIIGPNFRLFSTQPCNNFNISM
jgi:hypothetical protein